MTLLCSQICSVRRLHLDKGISWWAALSVVGEEYKTKGDRLLQWGNGCFQNMQSDNHPQHKHCRHKIWVTVCCPEIWLAFHPLITRTARKTWKKQFWGFMEESDPSWFLLVIRFTKGWRGLLVTVVSKYRIVYWYWVLRFWKIQL